MSVEVRCPACASRVEFVDQPLGSIATCPKCGNLFTLAEPALPSDLESELAAPAHLSPAAARPHPGFWGALLWCLGIVMVLQLLPGILGGYFAGQAAYEANGSTDPELLIDTPEFAGAMLPWIAFGQAASILIVCLVIPRVMGPTYPRQIGLRRPSGYHLLLAILALPGIMVVATAVDGLARLVLPEFFDVGRSFRMMASWPWYFGVLVVGLAPGIGEELWFRGFLGRGLVGRYGVVSGVLLTSLFFGLVHLDPRHASIAMTVGVALHLIYLASGSLLLPMVLHVLNNSVSILALASQEPSFVDATAGQVPWTVYAATVVLLAAVGRALYRTRVGPSVGPQREEGVPASDGSESPAVTGFASPAGVRPDAVGWVVPLAAACLFAGFTIRASVEYHRRMALFHPDVPPAADVTAMLHREPMSASTWAAWSKRLREWLPDRSKNSDAAFTAAREFLAKEFARGEPRPPMRDDAMAWYFEGRGMLPMQNDPMYAAFHGHKAEPLLRRSIQIDPTIGRAHYALAAALYMQAYAPDKSDSRMAEARREAAEGERLDPTANAKAAEAWAAMVHARYDVAARLYREAVSERPRDKELKEAAAEVAQILEMRRNGHGTTIQFHKIRP